MWGLVNIAGRLTARQRRVLCCLDEARVAMGACVAARLQAPHGRCHPPVLGARKQTSKRARLVCWQRGAARARVRLLRAAANARASLRPGRPPAACCRACLAALGSAAADCLPASFPRLSAWGGALLQASRLAALRGAPVGNPGLGKQVGQVCRLLLHGSRSLFGSSRRR